MKNLKILILGLVFVTTITIDVMGQIGGPITGKKILRVAQINSSGQADIDQYLSYCNDTKSVHAFANVRYNHPYQQDFGFQLGDVVVIAGELNLNDRLGQIGEYHSATNIYQPKTNSQIENICEFCTGYDPNQDQYIITFNISDFINDNNLSGEELANRFDAELNLVLSIWTSSGSGSINPIWQTQYNLCNGLWPDNCYSSNSTWVDINGKIVNECVTNTPGDVSQFTVMNYGKNITHNQPVNKTSSSNLRFSLISINGSVLLRGNSLQIVKSKAKNEFCFGAYIWDAQEKVKIGI